MLPHNNTGAVAVISQSSAVIDSKSRTRRSKNHNKSPPTLPSRDPKDEFAIFDNEIVLQGWLQKQKRSKSIIAQKTTKRWFTIEHHKEQEATLSYYRSPRASTSDRSGWIFLNDVALLYEYQPGQQQGAGSDDVDANADAVAFAVVGDVKAISPNSKGKNRHNTSQHSLKSWNRKGDKADEIESWAIYMKHPSRVFRLIAMDYQQHLLWFDTLKQHCANAKTESDSNNQDNNINSSASGLHAVGENNGSLQEQQTPPPVLKKLQPAEAIHKEVRERNLRQRRGSQRHHRPDLEAELEFIREMNSGEKVKKNRKMSEDCGLVSPNKYKDDCIMVRREMCSPSRVETKEFTAEEESKEDNGRRGTLVDDSDFARLMFNTPSRRRAREEAQMKPSEEWKNDDLDQDASIEEHGDVDGVVMHDVKTTYDTNADISCGNKQGTQRDTVDEMKTASSFAGDHRLQQWNSPNNSDLSIQKRLHKAILSPSDDRKEDERLTVHNVKEMKDTEQYEESDWKQRGGELKQDLDIVHYEEGSDKGLVSMVQEFSFFDDDDSSSWEHSDADPFPGSKDPDIVATDDGASCHDINDFSFCTADEGKNNEGVGEDPASCEKTCHDTKASQNSNETKLEKDKNKLCSISFDTDCSFKPDDDFVTADWDS